MKNLRTARPIAKLKAGRTDWYEIKNIKNDTGATEVYIYDEIGYFGVSASDFVRDIAGVNTDSIDLHVNSPGGDAFDGIAIFNALLNHRARVTTYVDGLAASAASIISMAGDEIVMRTGSQMMIHEASGFAIGKSTDMRTLADELDKVSDSIATIYASRRGGTAEEWREAMNAESWYTADEAVAAGLADKVTGGQGNTENSWDLSIFNYAGRDKAPAPATQVTEEVTTGELNNEFVDAIRKAFQ